MREEMHKCKPGWQIEAGDVIHIDQDDCLEVDFIFVAINEFDDDSEVFQDKRCAMHAEGWKIKRHLLIRDDLFYQLR